MLLQDFAADLDCIIGSFHTVERNDSILKQTKVIKNAPQQLFPGRANAVQTAQTASSLCSDLI